MEPPDLTILDCTLRDGEQAPGVFFTRDEKASIAELLSEAGVDVLDAGMPSVSRDEMDTLKALCELGLRSRVAATVRALRHDIDLALECGVSEVFLFMPVSPEHLRHKFNTDLKGVLPRIEEAIKHGVDRGLRVNFVAEDSVRADPAKLGPVLDSVSGWGAASAMICDTVGVMWPESLTRFLRDLALHMSSDITLGIHCHNDYGLATANTLAAAAAGCRIISGTINGLGERAGNAALEEVICAIEDLHGRGLKINRRALKEVCHEVSRASGVFIMPTKPIAGLNVFRHESGVHVDGMLRDSSTYESIKPEPFGLNHEFILGKHSGSGLVEALLSKAGIDAPPDVVLGIVLRIKQAKAGRDKTAFLETVGMLERFWAEHLSFSEDQFWEIATEELAKHRAAVA